MCSHQRLWGKPPLRRPYLRHCMNSCPDPSRGFWKWQACSFHLAGVTSCVGCRHVSADDQRTTSPTKQIFKLLNLNYFLPLLAILFIQKAVFEKYSWLKDQLTFGLGTERTMQPSRASFPGKTLIIFEMGRTTGESARKKNLKISKISDSWETLHWTLRVTFCEACGPTLLLAMQVKCPASLRVTLVKLRKLPCRRRFESDLWKIFGL